MAVLVATRTAAEPGATDGKAMAGSNPAPALVSSARYRLADGAVVPAVVGEGSLRFAALGRDAC